MTLEDKVKAKLEAKLGRLPTASELHTAVERKRQKKEAKATAAAPAADISTAPPAPAVPSAASKKEKKKGKEYAPAPPATPATSTIAAQITTSSSKAKKRPASAESPAVSSSAPAAKKAKRAPTTPAATSFTIREAHAVISSGSRAVAIATGKASAQEKGRNLTDDAFRGAWEEAHNTAQSLLASSKASLDAIPLGGGRLSAKGRELLLSKLRQILSPALVPASEVLSSCASKVKPGRKPSTPGSGAGAKVKVKPDILASAHKKLAKFRYDLFDAAAGGSAAYLTTEELKQLAIEKSCFSTKSTTKMALVKVLTQPDAFAAERQAAAETVDGEDSDDE